MTKCLGSVTSWSVKLIELKDSSLIQDNVNQGELLLNLRASKTSTLIQDIISDFCLIKRSACKTEKSNCSRLQETITTKLEDLYSEIASVVQLICSSKLETSTQHRYFIVYTSGTLDNLCKLLRSVGRLTDLDHGLYLEDQHKPLISEESITIHALTTIWSAVITIMDSFYEPASSLFREQLDPLGCNFVDQLEFSTTSTQYTKIFFTDILVTSWLQFNRLVRYQDLVQSLPFLCACHARLYTSLLTKIISKNNENNESLADILSYLVDEGKQESFIFSLKQMEVQPLNKYYKHVESADMSYYVVWHLYSVARLLSETNMHLVASCENIFHDSFVRSLDLFIPNGQQTSAICLSRHQEERLKLLFLMLNRWADKQSTSVLIIQPLFEFFDKYWNLFGELYFDNTRFKVDGLTVFQLCTKLFNSADCAKTTELSSIWDRLVTRVHPKTI